MTKVKKIKLAVDRLKPGIYVDLELPWKKHPFLFRRFTIKSANDIEIIKKLGLTEVIVFPEQCKTEIPKEEVDQSSEAGTKEEMWEEKKKRIEEATRFRLKRLKQAKEYSERVKKIKNFTRDLKSSPANAMRDAMEVADTMSIAFDKDSEVLINIVNFTDDSFTNHHHTLNVSVLTLSLAKGLGISSTELRQLCAGSILHDIGKSAVPYTILTKRSPLTVSEKNLLNTHPSLGGSMVRNMKDVSMEITEVIEQHHEFIDGSGFPKGLAGDKISQFARIVAITNCYDNLCNPCEAKDALTPKTAMAVLYAKYKNKLDTGIVQRFIHTMGVYPPGTVVSLSDDSIGLVTAVDSNALLQPQVLLYHPDLPRSEALHIDLKLHSDISITGALKPVDYPERIYDYLGIRERTAYFYEQLN